MDTSHLNNLKYFNPILFNDEIWKYELINMKRSKSEFCSHVTPKSHWLQLDHKLISASDSYTQVKI